MNQKEKMISITIALITIVILILFGFDNHFKDHSTTVYQVYLDGQKLGLIIDQNELLELINEEQKDIKNAYKVDKVDPTVSMSLKMNGRTITMTVTSATDAHSKIAGYEYTFKSADYTGSSGWITSQNYTTTVQYGGTYDYFCVTVKDNAGRTSQNCKRGVEVAG